MIPERRSAEVTPAVCKASAGAVEHLAIARVRNLADFLLEARRAGAWSYGADGDARTAYTQPDYRGKVVLVLGSEGSGLRPRVARSCDELIALPLRGRIESLNVSAAAAALAVRDHAPTRLILPLQHDLQLPLDRGSITWHAARLIRVDLSLRLIHPTRIATSVRRLGR